MIEKGLLLGLVPDELKSEGIAEARPADHGHGHVQNQNHGGQQKLSAVKLLEVKTPSEPKAEGSRDREQYRKLIQAAQDKFNRANYGQAITAYNEISAKFDDSVTEGSQHYWIGLSWYYLKEYKLAEESFQALQSRFPASPWVPHAGFYLAKVDQSRGFQQKALEQFQKILDENPSRDLGEMAQSEIERMREKL
ncbi:MAG: tetratricopeptide repeat protein [Cytophagaceae bacterium]|nr:MAG: tetratricopeptide repeat protein [Cytophagaceae bacterium]